MVRRGINAKRESHPEGGVIQDPGLGKDVIAVEVAIGKNPDPAAERESDGSDLALDQDLDTDIEVEVKAELGAEAESERKELKSPEGSAGATAGVRALRLSGDGTQLWMHRKP